MRHYLLAAALAAAATLATTGRASAYGLIVRPYYTAASFPCLNPSGYYSNSYYYAWYYPWYANYNYSHGPYANWAQWGGTATYGPGACGPHGCGYAAAAQQGYAGYGSEGGGAAAAGSVCVTLPADAKLFFNGTAAGGAGGTRTFSTPPLAPGQEYAYDLTAEVVRDGQVRTATERVTVRAGAETKVTLTPAMSTAAK